MGTKDDGSPDRRHRRAPARAAVLKKVRALEKLRDQGNAPKVGQRYRVHEWLTFWTGVARTSSNDCWNEWPLPVKMNLAVRTQGGGEGQNDRSAHRQGKC